MPDRVREKVEQGTVTVLETETEHRGETFHGSYSSLLYEIGKTRAKVKKTNAGQIEIRTERETQLTGQQLGMSNILTHVFSLFFTVYHSPTFHSTELLGVFVT